MEMIEIGNGFWNIRGSFKLGGLVEIGTQASLVRLSDGNFVFLDACALTAELITAIEQLTEGGKRVKAILNVHPFHTVYVKKMHECFPDATLYGTSRHLDVLPTLPWQSVCTESVELHEMFANDLEFSVPAGVDFVSANENVHFSSVLVFHRGSQTIHVDDTLMFSELPSLLGKLGIKDILSFHPALLMALQKRAGAADEFEHWATQLAEQWQSAENLCAAHTAPLLAAVTKLSSVTKESSIAERILKALGNVKWLLAGHRLRYG